MERRGEKEGRGEREGEESGEGERIAGLMSNYFLLACERLQGKTYYLFVCIRTCWNGHIRHEQPRSELIFFCKPDLNFQKVYTHSQISSHIQKSYPTSELP